MTKSSDARPPGRPSSYTPELAEQICERLAKGEPLARICDDDGMPNFSTVWRWEQANEEFRKLSARARELGTHYMADDCISIADGAGDPADKRIRIDTRLRLIGKWNAKNYGDRVQNEHSGPNGGPIEYRNMSRSERRARIEQLEARRRGADGGGGT